MMRTLRLCGAGVLGAVLAWLISEPFARTAAVDGTQVGSTYFTLGSFFGWFAHAALGAFVVGAITLVVNLERSKLPRTLLMTVLALALGGFLGWISDATSDRLMIHFLQTRNSPGLALPMEFFWNFAVAMSLAIGIALCCYPTWSRVSRIMLGGLGAAFLGFFFRMAIGLLVALARLNAGGPSSARVWNPFDASRLADHVAMGLVLGLSIGLIEALATSGTLRLVLGRNEGRDFPLGSGANRIGSAEGIEAPIFDRAIGPVQAVVTRMGGQFILQTFQGPAQVLLNGQAVQNAPLRHGDVIQVGTYNLVFQARGQGSAVPVQFIPQPAIPTGPNLSAGRPLQHRITAAFFGTVDLLEGGNELGRQEGLTVSLPLEASVSRRHALITIQGSLAKLSDLGSTNGTFINGVPVAAEQALSDGDVITLGKATVTYRST